MTTEATYRERTLTALLRGAAVIGPDLHDWPEDVRKVIGVVCELWHLKPPETAKSKGYWIASARELQDAASEYGVEAIRAVRDDFEAHMRSHGGLPPFSVEGPGSLVKATRAKAGQMRGRGQEQDRSRYISGEFAERSE